MSDTPLSPTDENPGTGASDASADAPGAHCLNCGDELLGLFCSTCAQKRVTGPLRVGEVVRGAWDRLTDLDRGFFNTVRGLTIRPGRTVREYISGKRIRHASPLRYYIYLLAVWMAVPVLLDYNVAAELRQALGEGMTPQAKTAFENMFGVGALEKLEAASVWIFHHRRWAAVGQLLPFAIGFWALFRTPRRTFAEWLAFALYTGGHMFILLSFGFVLQAADLPIVNGALQFVIYPYTFWALRQFSGQHWLLCVLKGGFVMLAGGMIVQLGLWIGAWIALF